MSTKWILMDAENNGLILGYLNWGHHDFAKFIVKVNIIVWPVGWIFEIRACVDKIVSAAMSLENDCGYDKSFRLNISDAIYSWLCVDEREKPFKLTTEDWLKDYRWKMNPEPKLVEPQDVIIPPFVPGIGDRLANRYGAVGAISKIVPDEEMPKGDVNIDVILSEHSIRMREFNPHAKEETEVSDEQMKMKDILSPDKAKEMHDDPEGECTVCHVHKLAYKSIPNDHTIRCPHCHKHVCVGLESTVVGEANFYDPDHSIDRYPVGTCPECGATIMPRPEIISHNANHDIYYTGGREYLEHDVASKILIDSVFEELKKQANNFITRRDAGEKLEPWHIATWSKGVIEEAVAKYLFDKGYKK